MPDTQIPVEAGILPPDFCPANEQERVEGYAEVLTVTLPGSNSTVIISTTVGVDDIGKLWVKVDGDGNPLGTFVYSADVGGWVRSTALTPPPGAIIDWYYAAAGATIADQEADAKVQATKLDLYDLSQTGNPFWRLCDGTNSTPDLRGRVTAGAGVGAGGLTPQSNNATAGAEEVALVPEEIPQLRLRFKSGDDADPNVPPPVSIATAQTWRERVNIGGAGSGLMGTSTAADSFSAQKNFIEGGDPADSYNTRGHENRQPTTYVWKVMRTARLI